MDKYNLDFLPPGLRPAMVPALPFLIGGTSGCLATCCIQPIDMVKVRLQLAAAAGQTQVSPIAFARNMVRTEGFGAMYKGLDAACARQLLYTTTRLGLFRTISDSLKERQQLQSLPFYQKCIAGLFSGAIGAFIGNPADLALVRMQSDLSLPAAQRKNYTGICDTVCRITREEGVRSLWKGATPTIVRAMALNVSMLATYDQSKEMLSPYVSDKKTVAVASSCISSCFVVVASLPFDFVKTCLQKQGEARAQYAGVTDCFVKNFREGGLGRFYASSGTFYARMAPHIIITFILREYFEHKLLRKH